MDIRVKPTKALAVAIVLAVATLMPIKATTQDSQREEPSPEEVMQMMGPMMGQMLEVMMEAMLTAMAKPETANRLATFTKNYYDALIAKGFSKDEALKIVTSVGIPSVPVMK